MKSVTFVAKWTLAAVLALGSSGCVTAGAAVTSAVVNTAVGVGASAVRRANGECYTPCNPGSACNKETGMCDPIPCGGRCRFDERCEQDPVADRCVSTKNAPITP